MKRLGFIALMALSAVIAVAVTAGAQTANKDFDCRNPNPGSPPGTEGTSGPPDYLPSPPCRKRGNGVAANGSSENDKMRGSEGNDRFNGAGGNDKIWGTDGDDLLSGGDDNDAISGGSGDDKVNGGKGRDRMHGGADDDAMNARDGERDLVTCGTGRDTVKADSTDRVARDCERVSTG